MRLRSRKRRLRERRWRPGSHARLGSIERSPRILRRFAEAGRMGSSVEGKGSEASSASSDSARHANASTFFRSATLPSVGGSTRSRATAGQSAKTRSDAEEVGSLPPSLKSSARPLDKTLAVRRRATASSSRPSASSDYAQTSRALQSTSQSMRRSGMSEASPGLAHFI